MRLHPHWVPSVKCIFEIRLGISLNYTWTSCQFFCLQRPTPSTFTKAIFSINTRVSTCGSKFHPFRFTSSERKPGRTNTFYKSCLTHNGWIYNESFNPKCLCLKTKLFPRNTYLFLRENYILTGKLSEMLFIFSNRKLRKNSYCSMRCSEKTLGELIMKCTCFLFPLNFSSKFLRIKPTCHMALQLLLL